MKPRVEAAFTALLSEVAALPKRGVKISNLAEISKGIDAERDRLSAEAASEDALERAALLEADVIAALEIAKARILAARAAAAAAAALLPPPTMGP